MKILIISLLLISGCTMKAEVSEDDLNKIKICTDTRDGEVFSFNTNSMTNVRAGFGGAESSVDIVTFEGKKMTVYARMEAYIKCVDA